MSLLALCYTTLEIYLFKKSFFHTFFLKIDIFYFKTEQKINFYLQHTLYLNIHKLILNTPNTTHIYHMIIF